MRKQFNRRDNRTAVDFKSQLKKVNVGVQNNVFIFTSPLSVESFADKIGKSASEILKYFFMKGRMLNVNTILSEEEIGELCLEFNYDFEKKEEITESNLLANLETNDDEKDLKPRPAVVTIMGHVDHGKTTLLDHIRNSHIVKGESGGITQHIGAYQIEYNSNKITFIDTPGHAAFTEMRARGASITDIIILVVAADDGFMPQTDEALDHAKASGMPIIVFINKIDKPNANVERVMTQLSEKGLTPEEWGGETIVVKGSAMSGVGVDKLLDNILVLAEIAELKANPNRLATGVVVEANLDKGQGPVATVLVKNGTLKKGDFIIVGSAYGHIRNMLNENKVELTEVLPGQPAKITGLNETPAAGDHFIVSNDEKEVKELAKTIKMQASALQTRLTSEALTVEENGIKKLNIILKTDVHGSLEAIKGLLSKIEVPGAKMHIVRAAIGTINESDIQLAKVSHSIIIGFNIKPNHEVAGIANNNKIKILFFDIIYKLSEEITSLLQGTLDKVMVEEETATAVVQQLWKHSSIGTIAGCLVEKGELNRKDKAKVIRKGEVVCDSSITSLRHVKENVNKIVAGNECGITIADFVDFEVGDIIQSYKMVEKK